MNCKQGDLAVIVKVFKPSEEFAIGRIVKCISEFEESGYVCWVVEPEIRDAKGVCDLVLRPIRDPGDDAKDETLSWRDVPQKVGA